MQLINVTWSSIVSLNKIIEIIIGTNRKFLNKIQMHFVEHTLFRAQCVITEKITEMKGEATFPKPSSDSSLSLNHTIQTLMPGCLLYHLRVDACLPNNVEATPRAKTITSIPHRTQQGLGILRTKKTFRLEKDYRVNHLIQWFSKIF